MATEKSKFAQKAELASQLCADPRLSGDQLRVAIALLFTFHNTTTGKCCPSYQQLASAASTTKRTAQRTTEKLKAMGIIDFEPNNGGRNKRNRYTLKTVSPAHPLEDENGVTSAPFTDGNGVTSAPLAVSPAHPLDQETVSPAHPHRTQEIKPGSGTQEERLPATAGITPKGQPVSLKDGRSPKTIWTTSGTSSASPSR